MKIPLVWQWAVNECDKYDIDVGLRLINLKLSAKDDCREEKGHHRKKSNVFNRRFRNNCEIVEEPNSSGKNRVKVKSESFVDTFCPWHDCQSSIDIKFLNYSGNV